MKTLKEINSALDAAKEAIKAIQTSPTGKGVKIELACENTLAQIESFQDYLISFSSDIDNPVS